MREKLFAIGDDFWIENEDGEGVFKVKGKALRIRHTFVLETVSGEELVTIEEKKLSLGDKMEVEREGKTVAAVKKALFTPLRERFSIEVEGGEDMEAKGNIVDHGYEIERGGAKVAEVSKRWFSRSKRGAQLAAAISGTRAGGASGDAAGTCSRAGVIGWLVVFRLA